MYTIDGINPMVTTGADCQAQASAPCVSCYSNPKTIQWALVLQAEDDAAWLAKAKAKEAESSRLAEEERRRKADRAVSSLR